jgi:mono/diheme cytochrome c family protein
MSWFARLNVIWRAVIIVVAGVVAAGAVVFGWVVFGPGPVDFAGGNRVALAAYREADPTGVPPELAHASLIERGRYLARAADCAACHTANGGAPFAGGLAFILPFGTIYSANITADKDTGIGSWSDAAFLNALHKGIDDEGKPLYPAMPYASYTGMTDADALAIKAYLFSLAPVHHEVPENRLTFPYDQRWLIGIWAYLFDSDRRFEPNVARSAQWNRGAYLAENLAHCGECHTPRNIAFALDNRNKFAGEVQSGWRAYNITPDGNSGIGAWSAAELAQYLSSGHADGRGTAGGPMGDAVDYSLKYLTKGDIAAIVSYLQTVPALASSDLPATKAARAPASHREGIIAEIDPRGKVIFEGVCASCHGWTGASPLTRYATLTGARAVNDPTATNVAQMVLHGTLRDAPDGKVFMPSFGNAYSDAEVAAVANYVTARFGAQPSSITAKQVRELRVEN